jgi:glucose/arabinose dehydrogenase
VTVSLHEFASGLESPVFATGRRDGSGGLLVVEQGGTIRIVNNDGSVQPDPFLDLTERVVSGGERGLLGLALHPDYENNGRLYVDYTRAEDGATVISEFQADDRFADASSERVLLVIPQPFPNHNGGMVAFDRSGMLMIGMGDGGGGGDPDGNGQNPQALLGKMLRIDVNGGNPYAIPADNPFAGSSDALPEIWALGMRNPWRFSFDRQTGDMWIGDVGQGEYEEVDAEPAGEGGRNYGWNIMEGRHCYGVSVCDASGLTPPVTEYAHASGCTVVGGYVYRGAAFQNLFGGYIFGDYCTGSIWGLSAAQALSTGRARKMLLQSSGLTISSFGEDDAGELYVCDLASGSVLKLTAAGG